MQEEMHSNDTGHTAPFRSSIFRGPLFLELKSPTHLAILDDVPEFLKEELVLDHPDHPKRILIPGGRGRGAVVRTKHIQLCLGQKISRMLESEYVRCIQDGTGKNILWQENGTAN